MYKCGICNKDFNNYNGLAKHIFNSHKEITKEEYYIKYINEVDSICICGNKKKFRGLGEGYRKFCSMKCKSNNTENVSYWLGKKQPAEMIRKRIEGTNQKLKEEKKQQTLLEKYNVINPGQLEVHKEKLSALYKGRKMPRTEEWQMKIIESKIKNNTSQHSKETKLKISNSINKLMEDENFDRSKFISKNKSNGISGCINGLFFRSSLELSFLYEYIYNRKYKVYSAENKKFRVKYKNELNQTKYYYPDFYIEELDIIVEIKPSGLLEFNKYKLNEAKKIFGNKFNIITEKDVNYLSKEKILELEEKNIISLFDSSKSKLNNYKH